MFFYLVLGWAGERVDGITLFSGARTVLHGAITKTFV